MGSSKNRNVYGIHTKHIYGNRNNFVLLQFRFLTTPDDK